MLVAQRVRHSRGVASQDAQRNRQDGAKERDRSKSGRQNTAARCEESHRGDDQKRALRHSARSKEAEEQTILEIGAFSREEFEERGNGTRIQEQRFLQRHRRRARSRGTVESRLATN